MGAKKGEVAQEQEAKVNGAGAAGDNLDMLISEAEKQEQEASQRDDEIAQGVVVDQQQEAAKKADDELREKGYKMGAAMAVSFMAGIVEANMPYVSVDRDTQQKVEEKLVPVMRKYEGGMPAWLVPYREELELGMVLAGAGFGVWKQVKVHQYELAQKEASKGQAQQQNGGQQQLAPKVDAPKVPAVSLVPRDPLDPNVDE